jgi:hypothetical protein
VNTLLGFALVELKFAPEPTASAAAIINPAKASSTLRGEAFHSVLILDMSISLARMGEQPSGHPNVVLLVYRPVAGAAVGSSPQT